MYTPAVTMVAAWIKAETGVGPSIASGNQTKSGICALLPVAASNRSKVTVVAVVPPIHTSGARVNTSLNCKVPSVVQMSMMAMARPKSPMRLTMNAFLPASAAEGRSNQKPMSR